MSMQIIVLQLDPANLNSVISNSPLFRTQNHFPWICSFSYLLSAISNSHYFEQFFVSPASSKWRSSTLFLMLSPIPVAIVEYCHSVKQAFLGVNSKFAGGALTPFYSAPSCLSCGASFA